MIFRLFQYHGIEKDERSITIERAEIDQVQKDKLVDQEILERTIKQRAPQILSGSSLTKKVKDLSEGTKLDFDAINNLSINDVFKLTVGNVNDEATLAQLKDQYNKAKQDITERFEDKVLKIRSGDDLLPSVMKMVKVFVATKTFTIFITLGNKSSPLLIFKTLSSNLSVMSCFALLY